MEESSGRGGICKKAKGAIRSLSDRGLWPNKEVMHRVTGLPLTISPFIHNDHAAAASGNLWIQPGPAALTWLGAIPSP